MSNSLFTDDIFKRIRSDKFADKTFLGVYPRDQLPQVKKVPCSAVINTDTSRGPGQNWIAFYIDEKRVCKFFDSYGRAPSTFGTQSSKKTTKSTKSDTTSATYTNRLPTQDLYQRIQPPSQAMRPTTTSTMTTY